MVLEVALIDVTAGSEQAFKEAYAQAHPLVSQSPGFVSIRMTHGIETPSRFVLLVEWESVEAHNAFRASDRFPQWRGFVGPHFAHPPNVEHFVDV